MVGSAFIVVVISSLDDDNFVTGDDGTDEIDILDFTVTSGETILVDTEGVLTADEDTIKGANETTVVVEVLLNFWERFATAGCWGMMVGVL